MSKAKDLKVGDCIKQGSNEYIVITNTDSYGFRYIKYKDKDVITSLHDSCEVTYIGPGTITYEYAVPIEEACRELYHTLSSATTSWYAIKYDSESITLFVPDRLVPEIMNSVNTWKGYPLKYVLTNNRFVE